MNPKAVSGCWHLLDTRTGECARCGTRLRPPARPTKAVEIGNVRDLKAVKDG